MYWCGSQQCCAAAILKPNLYINALFYHYINSVHISFVMVYSFLFYFLIFFEMDAMMSFINQKLGRHSGIFYT